MTISSVNAEVKPYAQIPSQGPSLTKTLFVAALALSGRVCAQDLDTVTLAKGFVSEITLSNGTFVQNYFLHHPGEQKWINEIPVCIEGNSAFDVEVLKTSSVESKYLTVEARQFFEGEYSSDTPGHRGNGAILRAGDVWEEAEKALIVCAEQADDQLMKERVIRYGLYIGIPLISIFVIACAGCIACKASESRIDRRSQTQLKALNSRKMSHTKAVRIRKRNRAIARSQAKTSMTSV